MKTFIAFIGLMIAVSFELAALFLMTASVQSGNALATAMTMGIVMGASGLGFLIGGLSFIVYYLPEMPDGK